jgi:uncharacterized protein (TIGR00369 family)
MPFAEVLEIDIVSGTADEVVGAVAWAQEHCTLGDALHGGFLMAVADSVGAILAFLNLPTGATTTTIESKTNFFRAVQRQDMTFRSLPVHVGRTMIVVQTDGFRADGKLATRTVQTQTIQHSPRNEETHDRYS